MGKFLLVSSVCVEWNCFLQEDPTTCKFIRSKEQYEVYLLDLDAWQARLQ
jgi:hypothetical protein